MDRKEIFMKHVQKETQPGVKGICN